MLTCMSTCFHSASVHVNNKQYARKMIYINLYKLIESLDNAFYKVSFLLSAFRIPYGISLHGVIVRYATVCF